MLTTLAYGAEGLHFSAKINSNFRALISWHSSFKVTFLQTLMPPFYRGTLRVYFHANFHANHHAKSNFMWTFMQIFVQTLMRTFMQSFILSIQTFVQTIVQTSTWASMQTCMNFHATSMQTFMWSSMRTLMHVNTPTHVLVEFELCTVLLCSNHAWRLVSKHKFTWKFVWKFTCKVPAWKLTLKFAQNFSLRGSLQ